MTPVPIHPTRVLALFLFLVILVLCYGGTIFGTCDLDYDYDYDHDYGLKPDT